MPPKFIIINIIVIILWILLVILDAIKHHRQINQYKDKIAEKESELSKKNGEIENIKNLYDELKMKEEEKDEKKKSIKKEFLENVKSIKSIVIIFIDYICQMEIKIPIITNVCRKYQLEFEKINERIDCFEMMLENYDDIEIIQCQSLQIANSLTGILESKNQSLITKFNLEVMDKVKSENELNILSKFKESCDIEKRKIKLEDLSDAINKTSIDLGNIDKIIIELKEKLESLFDRNNKSKK